MDSAEIVPSLEAGGPRKKGKYKGVTVKVYFNDDDFLTFIKLAERSGKRRVGLEPFTQKPHGFSNEKLANTDGIARFLKMAARYWGEHQEDLEAQAKRLKEEAERLKGYGVKV